MTPETQRILTECGVIVVDADGTVRLTRQAWQNATDGTVYSERPMLHFVRFKDDRFQNAIRVFGRPDFVHRFWDARAVCEVVPSDRVVFAEGDEMQPVQVFAYDDSAYF